VRGELAEGEEAADVGDAGGEGEERGELPVGGLGAVASCELAQGHSGVG